MEMTLVQPSVTPIRPYIQSWLMKPLNLAIIAELCKLYQIDTKFYDDRLEEIPYEEPTDLVAISVETYNAKRAYQIADEYRKRKVKVILGGFHVTLMPEEALEHADSIVVGEAEGNWKYLAEDLNKGKLKRVYNHKSDFISIPNDDITEKNKKYYLKVGLVESARGCIYSCNFCSISRFYNKTQKYRDVKDVVMEIKYKKQKNYFIVDDNIGVKRERTIQLFKELAKLKINWIGQISINVIDNELMDYAKKSGCKCLLIGFESLNEDNLSIMGKNINKIDLVKKIKIISKAGIMIYGTFVFGYDNDTKQSFEDTLRFALKNKLSLCAFNHLMPFPNTPLYDELKKQNRLIYDKWWLSEGYKFGDVVFKPKNFTPNELTKMCFEYRNKFYSLKNIAYRLNNYAHYNSTFNFILYIQQNLFAEKQVKLRQGLRLG